MSHNSVLPKRHAPVVANPGAPFTVQHTCAASGSGPVSRGAQRER